MSEQRNAVLAATRELLARVRASGPEDWDWTAESPSPGLRPAAPIGRGDSLEAMAKEVEACRKCPLGAARLRPAFGVGSPDAKVMFIGEGPGFEEDHRGEPFVGKAGQLLDQILASIGLSRSAVYIANIVKCHPMVDPSDPEKRGNDRPPTAEEMAACRPYLDRQIALIRPRVIVTLGNVSTRVLLNTTAGITALRGQWRDYNGIRLLPTFHPSALLRDPALKRPVWEDMKALRAELASGA